MAHREARAGAATDNKAAATTGPGGHVVVALEMGGGGAAGEVQQQQQRMRASSSSTTAAAATWACVAFVGVAGAGVLVWWAVAFHPARQQLWMVPVGLVLLGTPLLAWLALFASGACRWLGRLRRGHQQPPVRPDPE